MLIQPPRRCSSSCSRCHLTSKILLVGSSQGCSEHLRPRSRTRELTQYRRPYDHWWLGVRWPCVGLELEGVGVMATSSVLCGTSQPLAGAWPDGAGGR